jgi:CBS domain-containing protein
MTVGRVCSRETAICRGHEPLATVARLMMQRHVGSVVIVEDRGAAVYPVGIVTDRDLLRAALSEGGSLELTTALAAATLQPLTVREDDDLNEALDAMLRRGVRRAPVLDRSGALVGIVAVDDVVGYLGEQIAKLARLVETQPARERP